MSSKQEFKTEAELVEYEKYAVAGLIEIIPKWYEEVGMGGLLHSLHETLMECDKRAATAHDDADPAMRAPRQAVAEYLRLLTQLSRTEMQQALDMLAAQGARGKRIGEA